MREVEERKHSSAEVIDPSAFPGGRRDAMAELEPAYPRIEPVFPPFVLAILIACVAGAGCLANCVLLAAVLRRARNGLFFIIAQLSATDSLLLGVSIAFEMWSCNTRTWNFGRFGCIAFRGISVFASTASLYLIATLALHTLATINLNEKLTTPILKNNSCDEENRSSRHSLVANSDKSTPPRTMLVDYRIADTSVPVAPPSIFVWILSASLSIPEFALSTTIRQNDTIVCTLIDTSPKVDMNSMLALFNFFIPTLLMSIAGILLLRKLKSRKPAMSEPMESKLALKLSLYLIVIYFVLCAPRSLLYVYGVYLTSAGDNQNNLRHQDTLVVISLIFSFIYLVATLLRPLLCIALLPRIRKKFSCRDRNTDIEDV